MTTEPGEESTPPRRRQAPQSYEMIARVSGGMAHHLNNLLTAIILNAEVALEEARASHAPVEELAEILASAQKAARLVGQLLAFGRNQVLRMEPLDLPRVLAPTIDMLQDIFGGTITIEFLAHPEPLQVYADRGQLAQLVVNLVANARDAMPRGGTVTVRARRIELSEPSSYAQVEVEPGPYALLTVEDEGAGMGPEVLDRIFQPFFTTKGRRGRPDAGLGLSVVYGIVKQSGGYIFASSAEGRGSLFEVFLPEAQEE